MYKLNAGLKSLIFHKVITPEDIFIITKKLRLQSKENIFCFIYVLQI